MAMQYSTTVRSGILDAIETVIGTAPTLELRTGAPPASCASPDTGTVLVSIALPSNWLADASSGVKSLAGSWQNGASAAGTVGHFRLKQSATCHLQGTVTITGGGGDLVLDNNNVAVGQQIAVNSFTFTAGGA